MTRLLVPFTHGVDAKALDSVLLSAKALQATLISLALIPVPEQARKGVRLERIQQAKDFSEFIHTKAGFYKVPLERHECFTGNVLQSILDYARQLDCQGILLVYSEAEARLLQMNEVKQVRQTTCFPLYLIHLPPRSNSSSILARISSRTRRYRANCSASLPVAFDGSSNDQCRR